MSTTEIMLALFGTLFPVIVGSLVAFGVVKGKMHSYVTFEQHREMCGEQRGEMGSRIDRERVVTNREMDRLMMSQEATLKMVSEIHGFLKAQNGGSL